MAIELTTADSSTINSIRGALSAADSRVFLTQDDFSTTGSRVVCDSGLNKVKIATPFSDTQTYYESGSYTSAEWSNQGGAGTVVFVGSSPDFNNYIDNILGGADEASLRVEFNEDGNLLAVNGWGFSGSDASVTTTVYPDSPTAITSIKFYTTFFNRVELNNDSNDYGIYVYENTLDLRSTRDVTIDAGDDLRLNANDILSLRNRSYDNIEFYTNYDGINEKYWSFEPDGTTKIPSHLTFENSDNFAASGSIMSYPLSSGDGNGYTTMELHPDMSRSNSGQYLIIDPTAPNHIHIRAGGEQDNSNAELILGGENSYFKIPAGSNPSVYAVGGNNVWEFSNTGYLYFPDGGALRFKGSVPGTSIGTEGDVSGMIAIDSDYIYYCTAPWDGETNIWKRVQFSASTW